MDERTFRDAMGKFATGITIVSMNDVGGTIGMTVNAFMSLSLNPRLIAVSIEEKASMYSKFTPEAKFGVSVLKKDQKDLSMIFAKQLQSDQTVEFIEQDGVPVIPNTLVRLSCQVKDRVSAGDHDIIIAEVTDLSLEEGPPILYFGGKYESIDTE